MHCSIAGVGTKRSITVRITETPYRTLNELSAKSGLSVNQIASALITRALAEGWTVQPGGDPVVVPPAKTLTSNQGRESESGR